MRITDSLPKDDHLAMSGSCDLFTPRPFHRPPGNSRFAWFLPASEVIQRVEIAESPVKRAFCGVRPPPVQFFVKPTMPCLRSQAPTSSHRAKGRVPPCDGHSQKEGQQRSRRRAPASHRAQAPSQPKTPKPAKPPLPKAIRHEDRTTSCDSIPKATPSARRRQEAYADQTASSFLAQSTSRHRSNTTTGKEAVAPQDSRHSRAS